MAGHAAASAKTPNTPLAADIDLDVAWTRTISKVQNITNWNLNDSKDLSVDDVIANLKPSTAVVGVIFVTWSVFKVSMPYPIREEAFRRSNKLLKRAIALYASLPKPPLPPLLPPSPPLWKQTNLSHLSLLHLPGNA